ncbi:uncharacterized protein LOC143377470 [Andrena cerasifolii]|uniref:uncharacterized protein LOC143377470 n=1 Tax=Andrena cerasifolii TaxID=2819439 RepID=UPI0040384EAA
MKTQKCCAHCPGKLVSASSNESHECSQPKYVSGNLRVSSLSKHVPSEYPQRRVIEEDLSKPLPEDRPSCHDQFALAKRLHAQNLEHQPLPDKVDDSVFKNIAQGQACRRLSSGGSCGCCQQGPEGCSKKLNGRYGPVLGCKEPKTKMDLAICWEAPLDPIYEPSRPTHIDGSEGGLAPAIFTLVQRSPSSTTSLRSGTTKGEEHCQDRSRAEGTPDHSENKREARKGSGCECLCKGLNGMSISKKPDERAMRAPFRKCVACEPRNFKGDPRLIKSAVGLALGLETGETQRRKDAKATVPRPRTPFARRSFCIDTLAPPFSVMNGCRGADYPEHWRLMSVYQQSYKNPYRRRNSHRC